MEINERICPVIQRGQYFLCRGRDNEGYVVFREEDSVEAFYALESITREGIFKLKVTVCPYLVKGKRNMCKASNSELKKKSKLPFCEPWLNIVPKEKPN